MIQAWQDIHDEWDAKEQDGWLRIRGSELGYCIRRQVLGQMDMPRKQDPAYLAKAYADSSEYEQVVLAWLEDEGYKIVDQQRPFSIAINSLGAFVALHPDGIRDHDTRPAVVEIKSFGPSYYQKFQKEGLKGFPEYEWQLSSEMVATGLPGLLVVALKGGTIDDLLFHGLAEPPHTPDEIVDRVAQIRSQYNLRAKSMIVDDSWTCDPGAKPYGCPFWHLGKCPKEPESVYTGKFAAEIAAAAEGVASAKWWKEQSVHNESQHRAELVDYLYSLTKDRIVTEKYVITYEPSRASDVFDLEKLKADDPEHYKELLTKYNKKSRRKATVRVTERKESK